MKNILLSLMMVIGLSGCAGTVYADPPVAQVEAPVIVVCLNPYGIIYYRDINVGCDVGVVPYGYWRGGIYYRGLYPHYYRYRGGFRGGWHGGYRGGFHGGGRHR